MPILAFHKLTNRITFGSTNYSPDRFRRLLDSLLADGYTFAPLTEAGERNEAGERSIAFTFDDGYRHLLDTLPPLIERYRITPTIFVPTAWIGRPNSWDYSRIFRNDPHLSADDIGTLAHLGVTFGSHGHTHTDLTRLTDQALTHELTTSKRILEDITGAPVATLSYPFGCVNSRVAEYASACGYTHGYAMRFPNPLDSRNGRPADTRNNQPADTPLTLGRYGVWFFDTPASVFRKLTPGPLNGVERLKARLTNSLSAGTRLLHRLRSSSR